MKQLVYCTTIPTTFCFSQDIIPLLKSHDYDVTIVSSEVNELKNIATDLDVKYKFIPFYRGINPFKDIKAIKQMIVWLRTIHPDIILAATPKAAMVGMISSKITNVPIRIYHIYGLPFETAKGLKRKILLAIEKLTGKLATHIVPIGTSVKKATMALGLFSKKKIIQRGLLTIGGVDMDKFNPQKLQLERKLIRQELGISDDTIVIGYAARLTQDKGFYDLIEIWNKLNKGNVKVALIIIGSVDEREPINQETLDSFFIETNVFYLGFKKDIERYYSAMDIFLFPSHREGFGNVSIEASAMAVPVITYDVTGCKDAVENNKTGFIVDFKDYDDVVSRINLLIKDHELRKEFGKNGRKRVSSNFTTHIVAKNIVDIIDSLSPINNNE